MSSLPLVNEHEAARLLGVSVRSLQKGRCTGTGITVPFVKLSRRVAYRPEDLTAYVAANVRQSTSDPGAARAA